MRIVYKNGVCCKVDSFGRLIPAKTKPYGGRYGEQTVTMRIPITLVDAVFDLLDDFAKNRRQERATMLADPNYTTPGFEDKEIYYG